MVDYRLLAAADVDACVEVFYASDEALTASFNLPVMPRNPANLVGIFQHIAASTPSRAWVAEEGGHVIGFGMAAERGDLAFLSFLFILPERQGRGVGRALYERCMPREGRRATCIWSIQPVSASVYAREGLVPRVPIYTFTGLPSSALPTIPSALSVAEIDQAEVDDLDAEVVGFTRQVDHEAWRAWDRKLFGLRRGSDVVGYGYVQKVGRVGPVVVRRREDLAPFLGTLLKQFQPTGDWMVHVPGPAAETFVALLRVGMRFDGAPTIYCATDDRIDHSRYLLATAALP